MAGKTHRLKTWPAEFAAVKDGFKTCEVRFDDRGYKVGDRLLLQEFEPRRKVYTGKELLVRVDHVLRAGETVVKSALAKDWVVMSIERVVYRYLERF